MTYPHGYDGTQPLSRYCANCSGPLPDGAQFCGYCGTDLVPQRKTSTALILWTVIASVLIVAGTATAIAVAVRSSRADSPVVLSTPTPLATPISPAPVTPTPAPTPTPLPTPSSGTPPPAFLSDAEAALLGAWAAENDPSFRYYFWADGWMETNTPWGVGYFWWSLVDEGERYRLELQSIVDLRVMPEPPYILFDGTNIIREGEEDGYERTIFLRDETVDHGGAPGERDCPRSGCAPTGSGDGTTT